MTSLLAIVLSAALTLLERTWALEPADQEWNHAVRESQVGLYRMTRELRQGTNISMSSAYVISADVKEGSPAATQHVLYQCDQSSTCTRKSTTAPAAAPTTGAGGVPVINNVKNQALSLPVFTQPSTNYFQVAIKVPSQGKLKTTGSFHTITFSDGFFARNQ